MVITLSWSLFWSFLAIVLAGALLWLFLSDKRTKDNLFLLAVCILLPALSMTSNIVKALAPYIICVFAASALFWFAYQVYLAIQI